jgi:leucyl-tRNA synthetase
MTQGMVCHETYRAADGRWLAPDEVRRTAEGAVDAATGVPVAVGRSIKMSKSKRNVVDPEGIIEAYGADTARLFMLSDSPPDRDLEWTDAGVEGAWRFVNRLWRMVGDAAERLPPPDAPLVSGFDADDAGRCFYREIERTIARVTDDLDKFAFNRAVARIRELANLVADFDRDDPTGHWLRRRALETLVRLIGPMTPHLAEELWRVLGHRGLLTDAPWPAADPAALTEDRVTVAVQVNGKLRGTLDIATDTSDEDACRAALALPQVARTLAGRAPRKVVVVPRRIVNVVV